MKKQAYMAPATEIVSIELQSMIALSGDDTMEVYNEEVTSTDDLLSRRRSLWDADED